MLRKKIHLLVRDVTNHLQRYEKFFKLPKNNGIIFDKASNLQRISC